MCKNWRKCHCKREMLKFHNLPNNAKLNDIGYLVVISYCNRFAVIVIQN